MKMENAILIKNGFFFNSRQNKIVPGDIYIENGKVAEIGKDISYAGEDVSVIDASGLTAIPGLIDMHVHLREPGFEDEETIASGARAALKGGVTALAAMPNTNPPADSEQLIKYILTAGSATDCRIYPIACLTKGQEGKEMTEMGILSEAGAAGFSDDGMPVMDGKLMYEIMKYSLQFGKPLILHEEDLYFSGPGLMHEGEFSTRLGLEGIPSLADEVMIARDIMLAEKTGARIHITHLSSSGGVELVRQAKSSGANISCDVTPHHLFFNDSILETFNTNFKVKPPIRSRADQAALMEGLKDGTIDAIASDHAPHLDTEKNTTFKLASFGTTGLETFFAACYTRLVSENGMGIEKLIPLLTEGPAKILGIEKNRIEKGHRACIALVDTDAEFVVKREDFISKSKNSAFLGLKLRGVVRYTISGGKIVYGKK
ncbi:MAG: dihydroorotase [Actinobacteria bacterium]|nr:dihydroorotase [Actinomycetota bacterium]